ncbi:SURF1 family protein [uncultured Methylovirgula sp.]|uniref:SURF1 family protein n=1 Tax=uncultured Methylovirgula sp. TaxID=1285960 RepID=UPI002631E83B|nr:SURF1 family protein [uncultured Methylovirgula sp.]
MAETSARKGLIAPLLFAFAATGLLVSLGVWQLHRLAWKEALIARIAARSTATPQPMPAAADWPRLKSDDYDYRRIVLRGRFDNAHEVLIFRTDGPRDLGPGYLVLTPLVLASGDQVIVNRGYVPSALAAKSTRPNSEVEGEVTVTGLMRPPQPRNLFTPADDPSHGLYFSRDPAPIVAHFGLTRVAPFIVDADKTAIAGGWPEGGLTNINIPNNHMEYALTWFGLAGGLWIVVGSYILRTWQETRAKAKA